MLYKLLYILFIISISFGGNLHIVGTTPRQVAAVVMLLLCILNFRIIRPYLKCFFKLYIAYLVIALILAYLDDYAVAFGKTLLSQHLVAMASMGAIIVYYNKYKSFDLIIWTFVFCGLANAIVCILQYLVNPIGLAIGYIFIGQEEGQAVRHMEQLSDGSGSGYLLGMRGDAVHNGYFQMIMPFLLTHLYRKYDWSKSFILKSAYYLVLALFFIVILLIQERSCILIAVCVFLLYLKNAFTLLNSSKKAKYILSGLIMLCIVSYFAIPYFEEYLLDSRFMAEDSGLRSGLLVACADFIPQHLFLGGWNTFCTKYVFPPHNIFLNSLIEAGIFGFFIALVLYFRQLKMSWSIPKLDENILIIYAFIAYTLNSQLHNDSILTGDVIVWTLWGIVMCVYFNYKLLLVRK